MDQIEIVNNCLHIFCEASGEKVNVEKTCIFFSVNIKETDSSSIIVASGCCLTSDVGTYLGIPIIYSRINMNSFQYLINKVYARLSSNAWKVPILGRSHHSSQVYN